MLTPMLLYILEFVQLQMVSGANVQKNPYFFWFLISVIVIITILGIRVYIIDKRKENSTDHR